MLQCRKEGHLPSTFCRSSIDGSMKMLLEKSDMIAVAKLID